MHKTTINNHRIIIKIRKTTKANSKSSKTIMIITSTTILQIITEVIAKTERILLQVILTVINLNPKIFLLNKNLIQKLKNQTKKFKTAKNLKSLKAKANPFPIPLVQAATLQPLLQKLTQSKCPLVINIIYLVKSNKEPSW